MAKIYPKEWLKTEKSVHLMSLKELQAKFQVDTTKGLSSDRAKELLENSKITKTNLSYLMIFKSMILSQDDIFLLFLWVILIICVLLYQPLGGSSPDPTTFISVGLILAFFIIRWFFIAFQEYRSIKAKKKLQSPNLSPVSVLRDSNWTQIPACELVIGDVVKIKRAANSIQRVPVDLRLFMVDYLQLNKSILTGNNDPIDASDNNFESIESKVSYLEAKNMAFTNCLVISGSGHGIVVSTENNQTNEQTAKRTTNSSVRKGFTRLAYVLLSLSLLSSIAYLIVWAAWIRTSFYSSSVYVIQNTLNVFRSGFPVGLPITIILGLFISQQKLRKVGIFVNNFFMLAWISDIDVLVIEKADILARDSLEVVNLFYGNDEIDTDSLSENSIAFLAAQPGFKEFLKLCDFCQETVSSSTHQFQNYTFEVARKYMAEKLIDQYEIKGNFTDFTSYQGILIQPRNMQILRNNKKSINITSSHVVMIQGLSEVLLPKCKFRINDDGCVEPMNDRHFNSIEARVQEWSLRGRTVVCLCEKKFNYYYNQTVSDSDIQKWFDSEFNDLVFVGLISLVYPLYPGIKDWVTKIRKLGVRIVMMSSQEHSLTAASIANQVGVFSHSKYDTFVKFHENQSLNKETKSTTMALLLNGSDVDKLSKTDWKIICRDYTEMVLCNVSSNHKLTCVKEFQANAHSVLMVGNASLSAAALRQANMSIALGSNSTVTQQILLANNHIGSLYELLISGRHMFANIRRCITFSMISSVFSQYLATLLSVTIGLPQLYSSGQMNIVSGFTDVLASLSFFFEKPQLSELKTMKSKESLVSVRTLVVVFLVLGPLTSLLAYVNFFLYFNLYAGLNPSSLVLVNFNNIPSQLSSTILVGQTIGFYTIVIIQTFGNLYSIRTKHLSFFESLPVFRAFRNWFMIGLSFFVCVVATLLVSFSIPGLTMSIPPLFYGLAWACSFIILLVNEILKLLLSRF